MKHNVNITLLPEVNQVQLLIDTIDMYSNFCNYISGILHNLYSAKPMNKHYIKLVETSRDLHNAAHREFPAINHHLIPLAFRKVTKAYKYKDTPKDAYVFNGILDCSSYLISIKPVIQQPDNIGMLTISTLSGPQEMRFTFDGAKREELSNVFNRMTYREYLLAYKANKFHLSTTINLDQIKPKVHRFLQDPFRKGDLYL